MHNAYTLANPEAPAREEVGEDARVSFALLVERHAQLVYRIALAVTRHAQDAEDVAQEAFLELYRGGRWEGIAEPRAYLARMAWRLAVRRRRRPEREEELPAQLYSAAASPEAAAMDREMEARMHGAIDLLPEKLRRPLALAALGELKLVEIAGLLGLPEGTVRRRIHTARQKLKEQWKDEKGGGA